jgi:hypothetical protein
MATCTKCKNNFSDQEKAAGWDTCEHCDVREPEPPEVELDFDDFDEPEDDSLE